MEEKIEKIIKQSIKTSEKKMQEEKKQKPPNCARCHKPKKTKKHHWPLGSPRLVPLCDHCFTVTKRQRKRRGGFFRGIDDYRP